MRFLRTNTAARVTVGPFLDQTDGITPETSLTVTNCKLTLLVDDANVPTLVLDTNPTASSGNNDMVHVTGDDAGFYDLELTAANLNYLGRAMLALTDAANHCPVFHEFMILPAMIYDSLVLGTDRLDTNVTHVGDTSQTARDLGASVLLSSGTGTGQVKLSSGYIAPNWGDVGNPTTSLALTGTTIATTQKVDVETIKTNPVVNGGTITFPTGATLASTTNITAGTITTATNVTTVNGLAAGVITAASIADGAIDAATFAADVDAEILSYLVDDATRIDASALNTLSSHDPGEAIMGATDLGTGSGLTSLATAAALATVDGIVDDILVDTAEIGAAGAGLTNINLPNQTMDIVGNITGNLSGSVGSVTGTIGGLTAAALKDFFDTDSTTTYASAVAGSVVKEIADNAGGSSLSVQDIVDGLLDEAISGHLTPGTVGDAIYVAATRTVSTHSASDVWAAGSRTLTALDEDSTTLDLDATIRAAVGLASANLDTQLADVPTVAEFEARTIVAATYATASNLAVVAGYLDTEIAGLITSVDALPTNAELATALGTADDATLAAIAGLNNLSAAQVWASGTRTLTSAANITSTGGTTVPQTGDSYAVVSSGAHGNAALKTLVDAAKVVVDAILADTGTDGVALSAALCNKIADHVRRRTQANVEASSDGDTLSLSSLYGLIQMSQESNADDAPGFLTIYRTDGTTSLGTKTLATDADAEPVTGVS